MKKDAPNISAKDVPGTLRPLMSCALWRLHESIDRNDANRLFLLSDQTEIRSVAQKLNILVRSAKELAATIKSGVAKTDLGVFGDVEREFGIQTNEKDHLAMNAALKNGERTGAHDTSDVIRDQHDVMDGSISSAGTAKTGGSSILTDEHQEQHSPSQPNGKAQLNDFDQNKETPIHEIHEYSRAQEADNLVDLAPSSVPENILEDTTQNTIKVTDDVSLEDPAKSLSKCIDSFMLNCTRTQSDIPGQQDREVLAKSTPPANLVHEPRFSDDAQSPQKTGIINFATSPHNSESAVQTPLKSQALQDAEDSDEEVVVFKPQPKRFSAQKKSAPEKIRPLTPATQPQKEIARQNPTSSASASQSQQAIEQGNKRMSTLVNELQQQPVAESPTLLANGKHPRAKIKGHSPRLLNIGHAHPQPTGSLTVIDPDAFGRSFAVNTNSNSRPLQYANGHSNQRLRQNTRDPQMGQARRQDGLRNMSHPRHSRENSRQLPVAGASGIDGSPSSHSQRAPRTSSMRRPNALQPESAPSSDHTHVPAIQSTSKFPEVTEPTELLPRTKLSGTPSEPEVPPPPPRVFDSAEFVPRPHKPEPQLKFRPPKQRFIEPTEFVSRDFVPRTSSQARFKEQTPEPEYIERKASIPDVDYVLKSGSTRASARGRGRLWTPS